MNKPIILTYFLALAASLLTPVSALADPAAPGYREDQRMWLTSVERRSLSLQGDLQELLVERNTALSELKRESEQRIAELKQARKEASQLGWPFINDSKDDYDDLIKEEGLEFIEDAEALQARYENKFAEVSLDLMTTLAQSPNDEMADKKESVRLGSASHHNIEVFNAILNLQSIVRSMNADLQANPGDLSLAVDTYRKQIALLGGVITMCDMFNQRIDTHYLPELEGFLDRQKRLYKSTKSAPKNGFTETELKKLEYARDMLKANKPKLLKMQGWAEKQGRRLTDELKTLSMLERNASFLSDAAGFVAEINTSFSQLHVDPPTIVDYDLVDTDLSLVDPG